MTSAPQNLSDDRIRPPKLELTSGQGSRCLHHGRQQDLPPACLATPPATPWWAALPPQPGRAWTSWRTALLPPSPSPTILTTRPDLTRGSHNTNEIFLLHRHQQS